MAQVRQQNIVGRWLPSAGATGFRLIDRLGRGNHGTLTNMDPASAWVASGGQLSLNNLGTGHVEAVNPIVPNNGRFSLSIWVHVNSHPGGNLGLFSVGGIAANSGPYEILIGPSQTIFGTAGNGWCVFSALPVGQWLHLVCVLNGTSAGSSSIFIDGAQITPTTNNTPSINAFGTRTFFFMRREATSVCNCIIDDAIFFNAALTASEVREIYRRGRGYGIGASPHRSRRSAATTNRRRRLICGSNC